MSNRYGPYGYTIALADGRKARVFTERSPLPSGPFNWNRAMAKVNAEREHYCGIAEALPLGVHVLDAERCMISVTRYD